MFSIYARRGISRLQCDELVNIQQRGFFLGLKNGRNLEVKSKVQIEYLKCWATFSHLQRKQNTCCPTAVRHD